MALAYALEDIEALRVDETITEVCWGGYNRNSYDVGPSAAIALAEVLKANQTVTHVWVACCPIGDDGAIALAETFSVNQTITEVHLDEDDIEDDGAIALAEALKVNQTITRLSLESNVIRDAGGSAFAEALKVNQTLTQVALKCNKIGHDGSCELTEALKFNQTLRQIDLGHNEIGDIGGSAFAEALKFNQTITKVGLEWNKIGDDGACALAEALKVNQTITEVDLAWNQIGDDGACALAEALRVNQTVTKVVLERNEIGDAGVCALAEALMVNRTIIVLDVGQNKIGDAGASALADALKVNSTITQISLGSWNIGDDGACALAEALRVNKTIARLGLWSCRIGDAGATALAEAISLGKAPIINLLTSDDHHELDVPIWRNRAITKKLAGDLVEFYEYEKAGKKYEFDVFKTRCQGGHDSEEQETPKPDISVRVFKRFQAADREDLVMYIEQITGRWSGDGYASEVLQYTREYIDENYLKLIGVSKAPFDDLPEAIVQKILRYVASSGDAHSLLNGDLTPAAAGEDGRGEAAPISRQHDSSTNEALASLLSRSRQAASRSEGEALRAWRRVDRRKREALKRCRDWPLVRILEEIVVQVGSNQAPRVELELLAEQLEGGDESVMLFYTEQRRGNEVSRKVTLFFDSPFQRLLLHALCQFHDVTASSAMFSAASVDGENLSPTRSHEARNHEIRHAISIQEWNLRARSRLRLADLF